MGLAAEWPNDPEKGHFVLKNATWLISDGEGKLDTIPLETIDKILIAAYNVEMVEFIKSEESLGGNHHES